MTKYASKDVGFFTVGQYNLLAVTGKIEDSATLPLVDTTPLGVANEEYSSGGVRRYELTQEGWFDDAAGSMHDALVGLPAGERVLMLAHQGNARGKGFIGAAGTLTVGYRRAVDVGDVARANGSYAISGGIQEGLIIERLVAHGADGNTNGTYVDLGGARTQGGYVYLVVTSIDWSGRPSLTVTLTDSSDHIAFGDHTAMTAVDAPATGAAERKLLSADAVKQYLAVKWAWGGAGGSPSATFAVGVYLNPEP
mgnify:CR=1 FL=1